MMGWGPPFRGNSVTVYILNLDTVQNFELLIGIVSMIKARLDGSTLAVLDVNPDYQSSS